RSSNSTLLTALNQPETAYDGGRYEVDAEANANCPLLSMSEQSIALNPNPLLPGEEIVIVTATGTIQGRIRDESEQRHQIQACYVRSDYGQCAPPAFNDGFSSDDDFTFNGGPTIQAYVEGEGHVHSNGDMTLGPQVDIDGHATYTGSGDIHHNTQVASHGSGASVPMTP